MDQRPEQPPEGRLLAEALEKSGLSIREASRRAGISYGRWRQIVSGFQNVSPGSWAVVRGPAKTVARMAKVVGIQSAQMAAAGREDVAEAMRENTRLQVVPSSDDPAIDAIWAIEGLDDATKRGMVALALGMRQQQEEQAEGNGGRRQA